MIQQKSDFQVYTEIPTYKPPVQQCNLARVEADNAVGIKLIGAAIGVILLLIAYGGALFLGIL